MFNKSLEQCPYSDWERSARFSCIASERFHCLKDEYEQIGWLCIDPIWIESGRCPVYNSGAKKLDSTYCNGDNCPLKNYRSNEVYIKKACQWHYSSSEKKNETNVYNNPDTDGGKSSHLGVYVAVGVIVPLLLVLLAGVVFFIVRRKQSFHQKSSFKGQDGEKSVTLPLMDTAADKLSTALNYLTSKHFVVLKGITGSGKTYLANNVAESIKGKSKHQIKWIHDTRELHNFSFKSKNMILILDDVFYELQSKEEVITGISEVEDLIQKLVAMRNLYVIVTVPSYIWNKYSERFNKNAPFYPVVDLDNLNETEKEDILNHHLKKNCIKDEENADDKELHMRNRVKSILICTAGNDTIGYPSCTAWVCKCRKQSDLNEAGIFLSSPVPRIQSEIHRLRDSEKLQEKKMFLLLALMTLCGGTLNVENKDEKMFECLATIFYPLVEIADLNLIDKDDSCLSSLQRKYIKEVANGSYTFQLDVVRKLVFVIVIGKNIEARKRLKGLVSENLWKRFTVPSDKFPEDLDKHSPFVVKL